MTFYVTKYTLGNKGKIQVADLEVAEGSKYAYGKLTPQCYARSQLLVGRDCFERLEDAMADADQKRAKKIESIKRQQEKLQKLTFKVENAWEAS